MNASPEVEKRKLLDSNPGGNRSSMGDIAKSESRTHDVDDDDLAMED